MMDLRAEALRLFQVAVAAADPAGALQRALAEHPVSPPDAGGSYILIAVGKAAVPMAETALAVLRDAPIRALVFTNYENARKIAGAKVMTWGHPLPARTCMTATTSGPGLGWRQVSQSNFQDTAGVFVRAAHLRSSLMTPPVVPSPLSPYVCSTRRSSALPPRSQPNMPCKTP